MKVRNIRQLIKKYFDNHNLPEKIKSLLEKNENTINTYLYNADNEDGSSISASDFNKEINDIFWQVCFIIMEQKTKNTSLKKLDFSLEEELFYNFGFLDERLFNDEKLEKNLLVQKEQFDNNLDYKIIFLTDWFSQKYMKFMQIDYLEKIRHEQNKIQQNFINRRNEIELFKKSRKTMLEASLRGEELLYIMESMDVIILKEFELTKKIQDDSNISVDDRKNIAEYKLKRDQFSRRQNLLMADLTKVGANAAIENLDKRIKQYLIDIINFKNEMQEIKQEIDKICQKQKTELLETRNEAMSKYILRIKQMGQICARRGQGSAQTVVLKKQKNVTKKIIKKTLDFMEEFDIGLFKNYKKARPDILIIPGAGNGLYDWEENLLLIPFMPPRSYEESIASAIVSYKLDIDENKIMVSSLREMLKYKRIVSTIDLNKQLTKDYIIWMTKEAKGYLGLDKETRKWFMYNIAPKMNSIKIPYIIKQRLSKGEDREDLIKEYDNLLFREKDIAENSLYLGVVYALKEETGKAIDCLKTALDLDDSLHDAVYNLAMLYELSHLTKDAMELWRRYSVDAEESWWTILAKQHFKKMREKR